MIDPTLPPFPGLRPAAFAFLRGLAENNRRDWFNDRKQVYADEIQWPLRCLVAEVGFRVSAAGLRVVGDPRRALFRIYRDTRFSTDKSPYKTAQGAVLSPDGDPKTPGALYVHMEPGACFVAAGFWRPEADGLRAWRLAMQADPDRFLGMVHELAEQGLTLDREEPLKRLPRGFEQPSDPELAPYLVLRSFTVSAEVSENEMSGAEFGERFARFALTARPLLEFGWALY